MISSGQPVYTEDVAETKFCPASTNLGEMCVGAGCMAWRWKPLMADDAFKEAIQKAAEELGDRNPKRFKSLEHVIANRADYGLPTVPYLGYCGLAGGFLT